jgi:hypothetical protein
MVSSDAGLLIIRAVIASTSSLSQRTPGELLCHLGRDLVPHHHRVALRVALGDDGELLSRPRLGEAEREAHDSLDAGAGHHRDVGRDLDRMALVGAAADAGVLAFRVLAHDHPVEVVRAAALQRRVDAGQDARRPNVRVLVEPLADLQAQAPERDVVGDVRVAGGAEQDRVLAAQRVEAVGGHHLAVGAEPVAAPAEVLELEAEGRALGGQRLQHALPGRDDFLADAVAGDGRDSVGLHGLSPCRLVSLGCRHCRPWRAGGFAARVKPSLTCG